MSKSERSLSNLPLLEPNDATRSLALVGKGQKGTAIPCLLHILLLVIEHPQSLLAPTQVRQRFHRLARIDFRVMGRPDSVGDVGESRTLCVFEDGDEDTARAVNELGVRGLGAAVRILDFDGRGEGRVGSEVEEVAEGAEEAGEVEAVTEGRRSVPRDDRGRSRKRQTRFQTVSPAPSSPLLPHLPLLPQHQPALAAAVPPVEIPPVSGRDYASPTPVSSTPRPSSTHTSPSASPTTGSRCRPSYHSPSTTRARCGTPLGRCETGRGGRRRVRIVQSACSGRNRGRRHASCARRDGEVSGRTGRKGRRRRGC